MTGELQKYIAGALLVLTLIGYAGWGWEHQRTRLRLEAADATCRENIVQAVARCREGYVAPAPPATGSAPTPSPPSTRVVVRVDDPPPAPTPGPRDLSPSPVAEPSAPRASGGGCLDGAWLSGGCEIELVRPGGVVMARGVWDAKLRNRAGDVLLERGPEVASLVEVVQGTEDRGVVVLPPAVSASWSAELRAGIGDGGTWSAGGSVYGRSRWGGWVQAGPHAGAGGVAYRFGRL